MSVCGAASGALFACRSWRSIGLPASRSRRDCTKDLLRSTYLPSDGHVEGRAVSLAPEACLLRAVMGGYHAELRTILARHGGTVEKFVGDAAMAVFGTPQVHEDDPLRAVRAAVEMREAVASLGLEARIGVNTGEVVAGGETLVTGDAVNVAARLGAALDGMSDAALAVARIDAALGTGGAGASSEEIAWRFR